MKPILILKTGEFSRRLISRFGHAEQAFVDVLGEGLCSVVDARKEKLPEPDWAGIVVTGSAASANDTNAWIAKSEDFLQRAAENSVDPGHPVVRVGRRLRVAPVHARRRGRGRLECWSFFAPVLLCLHPVRVSWRDRAG